MPRYKIEFKPRAVKDLKSLSSEVRKRIFNKIELLENGLTGDVKRLTKYTPEYSLRVGNWRVLFEIEKQNIIIIYRVKHRDKAYL